MINSSFIRSYCLKKFLPNYRLCSDDTELVIPSIFVEEDFKRHMSINLETGLWQCFKSGERGNFIKLYSILENTSYRKAYEHFAIDMFLHEEHVEEDKQETVIKPQDLKCKEKFKEITFTSDCVGVTESIAKNYLINRKLCNFKFFLAKEGFYRDRLIIPFMNLRGEMFYFQSRALMVGQTPKYLNSRSIKSSHIVYPFDYEASDFLFITEGVMDALSLKNCHVNATSTLSCKVSSQQIQQLKYYNGKLVVAFDNDKPGLDGAVAFHKLLLSHKRSGDRFIFPPHPFKDWNEFYVSAGVAKVIDYLKSNSRKLDDLNLELYRMENEK